MGPTTEKARRPTFKRGEEKGKRVRREMDGREKEKREKKGGNGRPPNFELAMGLKSEYGSV